MLTSSRPGDGLLPAAVGSGSSGPPWRDHRELAPWPGPDPAEVAEGALVVSATAPRGGVLVVRAIGEIDLLTAPTWQRALSAATRVVGSQRSPGASPSPLGSGGPGPRRLVCDLSAVTFLGAAGVTVLVDLAGQAAERDVELCVIADDDSRARRLLELSGLDRLVGLEQRHDDAVPAGPSSGAA